MAPGGGGDAILQQEVCAESNQAIFGSRKRDATRQRALTVGGTAARLLRINQLTKALD
jgi:hypothetical protein